MTVDIISKGIVCIHMFLVMMMVFAGFPRILIYTSLWWGVSGCLSIPLCEEQFNLVLPNIWKYRHLLGLGLVYTLLLNNMLPMT